MCDASTGLAISGGYKIDDDMKLIASQPTKNGWQVTIKNETKARKTVTVYANCLVGSGGKLQTTHITKTVDGKGIATYKLACQIAGSVVGGGFDFAKSPDLILTESRLVGNEWVISVLNQSRAKQSLEAYAQCLSGSSLPAVVAENDSVKIPAGKSKVVEMTCETFSISGGYQTPMGLTVLASSPTAKGWTFEVKNNTLRQLSFKPEILCVGSNFKIEQQGNQP